MREPVKLVGHEGLEQHVGKYVCTSRSRTPLEVKVYGEGDEGGAGVMVKLHPIGTQTLIYKGEQEPLTGRWMEVDYGFSWPITEDTVVVVFEDEAAFLERTCSCE